MQSSKRPNESAARNSDEAFAGKCGGDRESAPALSAALLMAGRGASC
jgi:hypothetical protein